MASRLKRTKMPAQSTMSRKTLNYYRWIAKIFHDKTKFKKYLATNPSLQRIIEGKLEDTEGNYTQ